MTKFASLKKNLLENYHRKKKSGENSVIQQKHALTFPDLHSLIFHSSLYHTSLISARWEINETVNFRNFRKLFTNKFFHIFLTFWHPIFKREIRNEVIGHMKHAA